MEITELTEYEEDREPHEITLDSEMAISPRSLYREITCPICLDILSRTRAAPNCLHRFCEKCIDKIVKKECPICRKKLPSQVESFREDPKFDQLIAKIYNGYRSKPVETSSNNNSHNNTNNNNNNNNNNNLIAPECEIILRHLSGQQTRYLKCPENTTIDHLTKYLAIRPEGSKVPNLNNHEEYVLCIEADRSQGQYSKLTGKQKLNEIKSSYKLSSEKPLEFYFYKPPPET